jgi:HAD superfamily hydrolase (TIGR01509 family)
MDGVLVDSEVYWAQARREFAHDLGLTWTNDDHHSVVGRNTIEWARVMQDRLKLHDTMSIDDVIDNMINRMKAHYEALLPVRPGALEAVRLAAQHYRVGLASGSPTPLIQHVTRLTGLDQIFEVMVFGDDIPRGKPAPDIYLEALRQLGVDPSNAVGIEDSANGIRSLKAAGMYVIAAPSPEFPLSDDILALANHKIDTLEDFSLELVQHLN